jgi:lipoate-protein ligase A
VNLLQLTLPTPEENLALDEALLLHAEAGLGTEVLRLWEWPAPAVVLGSACRLAEVHEDACTADAVPVLRRSSGGGTVLLGAGCLAFSLVLRYDRHPALETIPSSYAFILGIVARALATPRAAIAQAGISDLALGGRKFSGNAQQRKRHHLLHHGTLLYAFDLDRVSHYLRDPPRQPEYRAGRGHEAFLCNLPFAREELAARLMRAWEAREERQGWPDDEVRRLVEEKHRRPEWVRRR